MLYSEIIQTLYKVNLFSGMKLGLQNISTMNAALNNPISCFRSILVAGTNGKGSVVTKIAQGLELSGLKTGQYTSPHIATFRERIRINGKMISEEEVITGLKEIFDLTENEGIAATFFEITTMLAFQYFAKNNVDIAVLEVGLGGKEDATNIVNPEISIITSISLDHTEILGSTIEEITLQKAGIIKQFVPILIGPRVSNEIIQKIAYDLNSPQYQISGFFETFDEENNAIAHKALEMLHVSDSFIQQALKVKPPCRMEVFDQKYLSKHFKIVPEAFVLDVAHNPDGLQHLFKHLKITFPKKRFRIICGMSVNKDLKNCFAILCENASHIHLVQGKNYRSAPILTLTTVLNEFDIPNGFISIDPSIKDSLIHAFEEANIYDEIVVACGTFFIMHEIRQNIRTNEDYDPIDINEILLRKTN